MSRPIGSRNTIPSGEEVRKNIEALRRRADQGDALAAVGLILVGVLGREPRKPKSTEQRAA